MHGATKPRALGSKPKGKHIPMRKDTIPKPRPTASTHRVKKKKK
jgi:hypothetical protein